MSLNLRGGGVTQAVWGMGRRSHNDAPDRPRHNVLMALSLRERAGPGPLDQVMMIAPVPALADLALLKTEQVGELRATAPIAIGYRGAAPPCYACCRWSPFRR